MTSTTAGGLSGGYTRYNLLNICLGVWWENHEYYWHQRQSFKQRPFDSKYFKVCGGRNINMTGTRAGGLSGGYTQIYLTEYMSRCVVEEPYI